MKRRSKGIIIATAVLVGTLVVGGTSYGVMRAKDLSNAKLSIKNEDQSLSSIRSNLGRMEGSQGYLTSSATVTKLNQYKNLVNKMKDTYVDFRIKKDDLKNEVKVVKIGKNDVLSKINAVESKIKVQNEVNALFTGVSIRDESVKEQPIKGTLTVAQINKIKLDNDGSAWAKSIQGLVDNATSQVQQITKANQQIGGLLQGDNVVASVTRDNYDQALNEVNNVKNPDVKQVMLGKLNKVLVVVESNEAKAQTVVQAQVASASSGGSANASAKTPSTSSTGGSANVNGSRSSSSSSQNVSRESTSKTTTSSGGGASTSSKSTPSASKSVGGTKTASSGGTDSMTTDDELAAMNYANKNAKEIGSGVAPNTGVGYVIYH